MMRSRDRILNDVRLNVVSSEQAQLEAILDNRDLLADIVRLLSVGEGFAISEVKSPTLNECKDTGVISETKTVDNLAVPEVNRPVKLSEKSNAKKKP